MKTIVGVRFRKPGKVYFFDPGYIQLNLKDKVVVETTMGEDVGEVVINKRQIPDDKVSTDYIIERQRMIKDEEEIAKIEKACEITDKCFSYLLNYIKIGKTEKEIAEKNLTL